MLITHLLLLVTCSRWVIYSTGRSEWPRSRAIESFRFELSIDPINAVILWWSTTRPLLTRVSLISRRAVLWVRCVKRKSGILLRGEEPRHQVDEVSVAIAREGEELVSLQNQLRIVVRKKRDYVEKIPKWRNPPPPPYCLGNPCYKKKSWVYFSF